uniref:H15 domain-containing protein n=1 Tax=Salvator merianae TaxID=96440 RepID=A0A8D0BKW1_SALMN
MSSEEALETCVQKQTEEGKASDTMNGRLQLSCLLKSEPSSSLTTGDATELQGEKDILAAREPELAAKTPRPPTLTMVVEAVKALNERKGSSAAALKHYILNRYPGVDPIRLKYTLKKALAKGLEEGYLARPQNSTAHGATGRFKVRGGAGWAPAGVGTGQPQVPSSSPSGTRDPPRERISPSLFLPLQNPGTAAAKPKETAEEKGGKAAKKPRAPKAPPGDPASAPKGAGKSHPGPKAALPEKEKGASAAAAPKAAKDAAKQKAGGEPPLAKGKPKAKGGPSKGTKGPKEGPPVQHLGRHSVGEEK